MGTTAEKGAYLNTTKSLLKQKINNLGGEITDETTFRQYANQLQGVYDNLPKTEYQEGTEVNLGKTIKGKLDFEDGIVGIGDISQKSYQGYQMIRQASFGTYTNNGVTFTQRADGSILVNGTANSSGASVNLLTGTATVADNDNNIAILPNQAYTLSGANNPIRVVLHTSSYSYVKNANTTFTETGNVSMSALRIIVPADTTINNVVVYPMLEKGSTAHDWEPYVGEIASPNPSYPQEIEVVRGKNRWGGFSEYNKTQNGVFYSTKPDGTITASGTTTAGGSVSALISEATTNNIYITIPKGTYTIKCEQATTDAKIQLYTLKGVNLVTLLSSNSYTFTLSEETKVLARVYIESTGISVNETFKIQIEKGSQATSYLPYNTLEVVERGINELNKDDELRQGGSIGAGTDYVSTRISISCKKKLKANTTYTLVTNLDLSKFYYAFVLGTKIAPWSVEQQLFDSGWKTNINYVSYTTNQECYINIPIRNLAGNTIIPSDIDDYWFMLYEGEYDSSIDYEPYQTPQTYQLSLGEYEFAKIGNYVDTIEYDVENDKVYKNEVINKYQFTGNENFGKAASTNLNGYIFNFPSITTNILAPANNGIKANILSNAFITKAVDTIISEATYGIGIRSDKYLYIGAPLGSFESVSALQTYLANNITFMYYTLETEVKEEITGTLKDQIKALYNSQSFTGTTIIEIDGQLPLIIKVRALKGN